MAEKKYRQNAHAVIIGINQYQDERIPNLKFARADAESIYQILIDPELGCIPPDNVIFLTDEDATRKNIVSAIGTRIPRCTADKDVVYIYYAGHGYPELDPRAHSHDGMDKYLVPSDAESNDLFSSGISMEEIQRFFSRIAAKQVIFFIDSCYSGEAGGRTFANPNLQTRAPLSGEFLDKLTEGEGRIVITACDVNEVSLEIGNIGHGLFTHYLSEGLKGKGDIDRDGLVSIGELYDYVYENVSREARKYGGSMQPVRKGSVKGKIFVTQYETDTQKRARERREQAVKLHSVAKKTYQQGNIEEAYRLWQKVLAILPEDENARKAIAAIDRKREEEQKKNQQILERRQAMLLHLYEQNKLPVAELERGMTLLEKQEQELTDQERRIYKMLNDLTDNKISVETFLRIVDLQSKKIVILPEEPISKSSESERQAAIEEEYSEKENEILDRPVKDRKTVKKPVSEKPEVNKVEKPIKTTEPRLFRSKPRTLTEKQVNEMLKEKGFFDSDRNPKGLGFKNNYEVQKNGEVVVDHASGLTWQQSGFSHWWSMPYKKAFAYIGVLNAEKFAGYSDWRLPTLEEAMSLMETKQLNGTLFIDPKFSKKQKRIWTSDKNSPSRIWVVNFDLGLCRPGHFDGDCFVRAVRS